MAKLELKTLIKRINAADVQQAECQFDIANILTAIRDHKLFEQEGYTSFAKMVSCELDFHHSTASKYISLYNSYTRLRYTKSEFLKLMRQFGWRSLHKAIVDSDRKMGHRAVKNKLDSLRVTREQFNFNLTDERHAARITHALSRFGLEVSKSGHRHNMTSALLALLDDYERLSSDTSKRAA